MSPRRGTTLVEVLVAILMLSLGFVFLISTLVASLKVQSLGKNKLIALNIAREGLEGVRNLRDTNWLVNSGKKRECWNYNRVYDLPGSQSGTPYTTLSGSDWFMRDMAAKCEVTAGTPPEAPDTNGNPLKTGYYLVDADVTHTMAWRLFHYLPLEEASKLDLTTNPGVAMPFQLFVERETEENASRALSGMYTHTPSDDAVPSPFYRQIRIRYLCDEGSVSSTGMTEIEPSLSGGYPIYSTSDCETSDTDGVKYPDTSRVGRDDNRMEVVSTVLWMENGKEQKVELAMHLTDWLGRIDHEL